MRQQVETNHELEIKHDRSIFVRALSYHEFLRPAVTLAYHGKIDEALDAAEEIWIAQKGDMHGISFRVVTTSRIVSMHGSFESFEN
jgi:hypothetical protein